MNYPDDFNVPTFTAGKSIAVSRAAGIGIMSGFLIILFLCGLLVWTIRSVRVEPYILTTGGINDEWQIIAPGANKPIIEMTGTQVVQESLVWKFVQNWFSVSGDGDANAQMWDTSCQRTDCDTYEAGTSCKLFCASSDDLFRRFREDVLPTYQEMYSQKEYWTPIVDSIRINPVGRVNDAGGTWRVEMSVATSGGEKISILAYAKVAQSKKYHPSTMGYYIADFNAYRGL